MEVEVHPTAYVRCGVCGEAVDVLTRPGTDVSFVRALRGALFLPVGIPGLVVLGVLTVVSSELDTLSEPSRSVGLLAWSAVAWLVGVAIVHATANGATALHGVPVQWPDLVRPALVAASLTAPALLVPRTGLAGTALTAASAPLLVPLLLGVLALLPLREALSPLAAWRMAAQLGMDGFLAVLCVALSWLFARMLGALAESPATEVPLLWRQMMAGLAALSLFFVPRVLGLLLEARGDEVGYPFGARGRVPVLPSARPERTEAYRPPDVPMRAARAPIALEETARELELEPLAPTLDNEK